MAAAIPEKDGSQAVSTRSVAAAAGIRAASLYQLFGDKDGLLAALAIQAFDRYLAEKHTPAPTADPVEDVRCAGTSTLISACVIPPATCSCSAPTGPGAGRQLLKFLNRVAAAGRLRVPAARALALDAALTAADEPIPLRPTETALLRDWLQQLAHWHARPSER